MQKHLPGLQFFDPYVTREMRVRDLLCHRNGLAPFAGDLAFWGSTRSRQGLLAGVRFLEPLSSFRSRYAYQNGMFTARWILLQLGKGTLEGKRIYSAAVADEMWAAHTPLPVDVRSNPTAQFRAYALDEHGKVEQLRTKVDDYLEPNEYLLEKQEPRQ